MAVLRVSQGTFTPAQLTRCMGVNNGCYTLASITILVPEGPSERKCPGSNVAMSKALIASKIYWESVRATHHGNTFWFVRKGGTAT